MTAVLPQIGAGASGSESLSPDRFKAIFRHHPAGVAVVTLTHGDRLVGFTSTSVISVSAEPPLLAFSVAGGSSSWIPLTDRHGRRQLPVGRAGGSVRTLRHQRHRSFRLRWLVVAGNRRAGAGRDPAVDPCRDRPANPIGSSHLVCLRAIGSSVDQTPTAPANGQVPPLVYHDRVYHQLGTASAV